MFKKELLFRQELNLIFPIFGTNLPQCDKTEFISDETQFKSIVFGGYYAAFLFAGGMEAIFSFFAVFIFPAASNSSKNRKQSSNCGDYLKFLGSFPAVSAIIPSIVVFFYIGLSGCCFLATFSRCNRNSIRPHGFCVHSNTDCDRIYRYCKHIHF